MTILDQLQRESRGETGLKGAREGFLNEEYLPELRGIPGMRKFREMQDSDPVIGGVIYAFKTLLARVNWRVKPADKDGKALEAAQFAEEVFFKDMALTWKETLSEIYSMLTFGFSLFELVYKIRDGALEEDRPPANERDLRNWLERRKNRNAPGYGSRYEDKKVGLHMLAPRAQETVWQWHFDREGTWLGIDQQTENSNGVVFLPYWKLANFRTDSYKNNPMGRSILRSAHTPYERKKVLEIAEGRLGMRVSGIGQFDVPLEIMRADLEQDPENATVWASITAMMKKVAKDQQGAFALPSDRDDKGNRLYDFNFKSPNSTKVIDLQAAIVRYESRIAMCCLADFMMLGQNGSGSNRALAEDKTEMFETTLNYFSDSVADVLNKQVLPRLWEINGFDPEIMPELQPSPVDKRDVAKLATFLKTLTEAGATIFPNPDLVDALFDEAQLPPIPDEVHERAEAQAEQADAAAEAQTLAAINPREQNADPGAAKPKPKPKPSEDSSDDL